MDCNKVRGLAKIASSIGILLLLLFSVLGCTQYLITVDQVVPDPPPLAQAAPRLSQLTVTPSSLARGRPTIITITFRYEDWNQDVGPTQAKVWRSLEVISGNLALRNPTREFWVDVDHHGRWGTVSYQMEFYIPSQGFGEIRLSLALYDRHGNKSTPISTILTIQ